MRARAHRPHTVYRTHRRPGSLPLGLTPDDRRAWCEGSHQRNRPGPALRRAHRPGRAHRQRPGRHRDHQLAIQTARTHPASLTGTAQNRCMSVTPMIHMERPVVGTESGSVQGTSEGGVAAFRGIPYAASPVGDRRFAAPGQHPKWPGLRDATRPGPSVPQGPSRLEAVMGRRTPDWDEDGSLTLNVWTPRLPVDGPAPRALPVLVWFHGGGFTSGSGGWEWYDGRNLAAAGNIVVVTANYRIGPLGYLYLPELGIENLGVRDQAAVLAWVERNITAFGGDPGALTVGGQSAGAFSALYHALSPVTGPHINRVITQSGPWGLAPQHPSEAAD